MSGRDDAKSSVATSASVQEPIAQAIASAPDVLQRGQLTLFFEDVMFTRVPHPVPSGRGGGQLVGVREALARLQLSYPSNWHGMRDPAKLGVHSLSKVERKNDEPGSANRT